MWGALARDLRPGDRFRLSSPGGVWVATERGERTVRAQLVSPSAPDSPVWISVRFDAIVERVDEPGSAAAEPRPAVERLVDVAREVYEVGGRKGMISVTDETGSDRMVGVFVPAALFNRLGAALARFR